MQKRIPKSSDCLVPCAAVPTRCSIAANFRIVRDLGTIRTEQTYDMATTRPDESRCPNVLWRDWLANQSDQDSLAYCPVVNAQTHAGSRRRFAP